MSSSQITPERFEKAVKDIEERYAQQPTLMRAWLEVLMSNTLVELGYPAERFQELALEFDWVGL